MLRTGYVILLSLNRVLVGRYDHSIDILSATFPLFSDPSKARVLYDSKILKCGTNKTKKTPEYLVHFYGWNSSWDRRVPEENILKDVPQHRQLQRHLAEEAAQGIKWKKVKLNKIPAIIKEVVLSGSQEDIEEADSGEVNECFHRPDSATTTFTEPIVITTTPDTDSVSNMTELLAWIPLPDEFKKILEVDRERIAIGDYYNLPLRYTVAVIMNDFLETVERKDVQDLLPNFNRRSGVTRAFTQTNSRCLSDLQQLVDEFTNSMVIYFNSVCNTHLFYNEDEKRAFSSLGITPSDCLGFIHLLRFLVVLPDFIRATTTMNKKQVTHLTSILETFYFYLKKKQSTFL